LNSGKGCALAWHRRDAFLYDYCYILASNCYILGWMLIVLLVSDRMCWRMRWRCSLSNTTIQSTWNWRNLTLWYDSQIIPTLLKFLLSLKSQYYLLLR